MGSKSPQRLPCPELQVLPLVDCPPPSSPEPSPHPLRSFSGQRKRASRQCFALECFFFGNAGSQPMLPTHATSGVHLALNGGGRTLLGRGIASIPHLELSQIGHSVVSQLAALQPQTQPKPKTWMTHTQRSTAKKTSKQNVQLEKRSGWRRQALYVHP